MAPPATPAKPVSDDAAAAAESVEAGRADAVGDEEAPDEAEGSAEAPEGPADTEASDLQDAEDEEALANAGVAGNLVDRDDPNASRATSDLEGESLGDRPANVPDRMRPLQAAGWWTLFGTAVLGTAGGVFAGLAERQEDEAVRVTQLVDLSTGSKLQYSDVSEDYEAMLQRGENFSWAARGFFIAGAATAVTSVTLFILDRRQQKQRRLSFGPGSASVRF